MERLEINKTKTTTVEEVQYVDTIEGKYGIEISLIKIIDGVSVFLPFYDIRNDYE